MFAFIYSIAEQLGPLQVGVHIVYIYVVIFPAVGRNRSVVFLISSVILRAGIMSANLVGGIGQ